MTSKWIKELTKAIFNMARGLPTDKKPDETINRIDNLLRRAMNSTDDENLHDEIEKEIKE